ncbi:MAG: hypothetical protein KGY99_03180 [Phycisphaerae bacterium]|nr:hypothetical protein [Phycisphaerae bacterium]
MAEKTPVVRNTKLLLIALGLGLLVAIVYNVHVKRIREAGKGDLIYLLKATDDLDAGTQISQELGGGIMIEPIPRKYGQGLGPFIRLQNREEADDYEQEELLADVRANEYIRYEHISETAGDRPSQWIDPKKKAVPLSVEAQNVPDAVNYGDRVDVIAPFYIGDEGVKRTKVFSAVRVVPPETQSDSRRTFSIRGRGKITIELDPDDAMRWENLRQDIAEGLGLSVHLVSSHPDADYGDDAGGFAREFTEAFDSR